MLLYRLVILLLFSAIAPAAYSQTATISTLKKKIDQAASDEERINHIFSLCGESQSMSTETHRYYVSLAVSLSNRIGSDYYKDLAKAERAFLMAKDQKTDSALVIVEALLKKYETSGDRNFISKLLALKGRVLTRGFRSVDMINATLAGLQECEKYNDTLCMVMTMNSMGWGYLELGKNEEALSWLRRALQLHYSDAAALRKYNCLYSNTALAFHRTGRQDSAEYYIEMAIRYARETETLTFLANALSFRAEILMRTPYAAVARTSLNEALEIRKQLGDSYYILYDLADLASFYAFEKDYAKSIALCLEGIDMSYSLGMTAKLPELYQLLANNYEATGDHAGSIRTMKKLILVTDSLSRAFTASLSDIETRYEVQKKENVIMKQQFDLSMKNYFLFGSLLLLLVVIVSGYFLFRENRRRQQMKMQVMRDEEKRMAAQAVADAEDAERKRIAADLHDNLGAQANAILYSTELLQHDQEGKELLVNGLHDTARDMLTSLRETLWALKNTTVNAADIWLRLISFTKQLGRHYTTVRITAEGTAPQLQLSSAKALNIVFIMQEAMNNAVRHSGGENISITSEFSDTRWKLEVTDNGKGFDLRSAGSNPESYGLSNIMQRASVSGMVVQIDTAGSTGTRVELTVPREG